MTGLEPDPAGDAAFPGASDAALDPAFERARPRLFAIAYRMLGSASDADDVLQDAWLRWTARDRADVESPERFLATVTTRLALDLLRRRQSDRERYEGPWLPEPDVDPEPEPARDPAQEHELADTLSTAFLVLLERLAPVERAAFLLREVFGYEYADVAAMLERPEATCRQIVKRARDRVAAERPARFRADRATHARLTSSFLSAVRTGDLERLLDALGEDVVLVSDHGGKAIAARRPIEGASAVAAFLLGVMRKAPADLYARVVGANGEPALALGVGTRLETLFQLEIEGDRIRRIYVLRNPDKLARAQRRILGSGEA